MVQIYVLVKAELARVNGDANGAMRFYEEAITLAHQYGFLTIEALAYELYARHLIVMGFSVLANNTMNRAVEAYTIWGAKSRVEFLYSKYGNTLDSLQHRSVAGTLAHPSHIPTPDDIDSMIIVRAVQLLSQGIESHGLLERFVTLVVQSAGAQKGAVVLKGTRKRHGGLLATLGMSTSVLPQIEDELKAAVLWDVRKTERPNVFISHIPLAECPELPADIIQAVATTQQHVLIQNLAESDFCLSKSNQDALDVVSSVICLPILQGTIVVGVMYLAHSATGVFTRERLRMLELLCAQLGILLENSMLYESVQESKRMYVAYYNVRNSLTFYEGTNY